MANRVTIVFDADGSAYVEGVEKVNDTTRKMESETKSMTAQIKEHWMSVVAAVYAVKKAWDFAEEAAKVEELKQSFTNLAASHGVNANQLIANLRRVSAETISAADLMRAAGSAMVLGIPADRLAEMMEIARASAKITGQTVQKSFEDIGLGIARQSKMILDNLGIIVNLEKEYEKYARSLGKTASELTEAEKKQAFLNAAMEAGKDIVKRVGDQGLTAAEAMAQFTAKLQDLRVIIGQVLITATSWVGTALMGISKAFANLLGFITDVLSKLAGLGAKLPWVGDKFKGLSEALKEVSEFEKSVAKEAERMGIEAFNVGAAIWKEKEAVVGLTNSLKDNVVAVDESAEAFKEASIKILQDEAQIWIDQEEKYKKVRGEMFEKRVKEYEDLQNRLAEQRIAANQKLAEMEKNSPYGYQQGEGGELAGVYLKYQMELQALQAYNTQKLQLMVEAGATQYQVEQEYERLTTQMKEREFQLRLSAAANFAGGMANFFQNLYVATGKQNRALFEAGKMFAIAHAVMNTAEAATAALKAPPGPPWSFAYVGAAIAAGMAQIQTISSTQPGGGAINAGGAAMPSYSGGSPSAYPVPQRIEPESKGAVTEPKIEINIYHPWGNEDWDEIMEEKIMPAYNRAKARNL